MVELSQRRRILFFTRPEYGQSSVALAVAYELASRNVDMHFASFPGLNQLKDQISKSDVSGAQISFHPLTGLSMMESLARQFVADDLMHGDWVRKARTSYQKLPRILATWSG